MTAQSSEFQQIEEQVGFEDDAELRSEYSAFSQQIDQESKQIARQLQKEAGRQGLTEAMLARAKGEKTGENEIDSTRINNQL